MDNVYVVLRESSSDPYSDCTFTSIVAAFATMQSASEYAEQCQLTASKNKCRWIVGYSVEAVDFENR